MSVSAASRYEDAASRHRKAVATTLSWADEAAASGDYHGALAWLRTVECIGDALPAAYQIKRGDWRLMVDVRDGHPN